jgi:hypothetical protein
VLLWCDAGERARNARQEMLEQWRQDAEKMMRVPRKESTCWRYAKAQIDAWAETDQSSVSVGSSSASSASSGAGAAAASAGANALAGGPLERRSAHDQAMLRVCAAVAHVMPGAVSLLANPTEDMYADRADRTTNSSGEPSLEIAQESLLDRVAAVHKDLRTTPLLSLVRANPQLHQCIYTCLCMTDVYLSFCCLGICW